MTDQTTKASLPAQSPPVEPPPAAKGSPANWLKGDSAEPLRRNLGLIGVLVILVIIGVVTRPELYGDATWVKNNVFTILQQASAIGVVTVGMTCVIIGGGIDLSVGAIIAVAGVWSTTLATQSYGTLGMIFTAIVVGTVVGLINGVLISYGRLVPFIATLAMMVAARLVLSPATARTHVSRAMVKLSARDRAQLVVFAYQSGLVD